MDALCFGCGGRLDTGGLFCSRCGRSTLVPSWPTTIGRAGNFSDSNNIIDVLYKAIAALAVRHDRSPIVAFALTAGGMVIGLGLAGPVGAVLGYLGGSVIGNRLIGK